MKRHLLSGLLLAGLAASLPLAQAQAQDKPVLNSAPPGPPPAPPRPVDPAPTTDPATAPTPAPDFPAVEPTPDNPSGLRFPGRTGPGTGTKADQPLPKFFLYTNFGLGFSSYGNLNQFNGSLAPAIGYRVTDKFAVGPGLTYSYNSYSLSGNSQYGLNVNGDKSIKSNSIGVKAFAQYTVYKEFFVHAEYELTNAQLIGYDDNTGYYKYKKTASTPLAGIGYRSALGERAAVDIVGLYNFDNTVYSLYPGLVLRFSFLYNLGR